MYIDEFKILKNGAMLKKSMIAVFLVVGLGAQTTLLEQAEAAYKRKDYPKAFKLYKQGAQRGEAQAFYHLGLMYYYGQYVDMDIKGKKAFNYFKKAGEMGVADAYLELADMVADGRIAKNAKGEPFACEKALSYANKALELNPKRADIYERVGFLYLRVQWSNHTCSLKDFSQYSQEVQYKQKIFQKGSSYLEKAGEMGDFNAYITLGYYYAAGDFRFERSFKKAKQYYLKAVAVLEKAGAKGDSQAYNELGLIYQDESRNLSTGTILENRHKAVAYFQKAVAMGNANAYTNMGQYVDENKAMEYYKKAGELGDAQGYIKLAQMEGTLLSKSIEYLKAAGDLGDEDGYGMLGDIYFYGGWEKDENDPSAAHIPRDYKRAAHYYQKCADMGEGHCYLWLAKLYKKGLGVPKDAKKARAYEGHGRDILCVGEDLDDYCE
ncbi:tetratricopeptide repeat protein [Helicobacter felis]|uniref:tetratricopeptide repeat protein n=1 Tax=Helicobacter felis TaxID=214 RepID=UPI000EF6AFB4|nr:tetratricopeptide repeat protein [Helicobacter felis]